MAISRSLMSRQLQANGGIMQVAPREKFGIGSKLKKFVRKIIPNEVADIAVKAAPFVAPFNPALAGAMAGIGSFDQTGSIGDSLKRGALTYGGGQLARYAGGAGFQGNPFASGGAFTPSGFTAGFSSPIGTETGLGKFFSNRGTQGVEGVDYVTADAEPVKSSIIDQRFVTADAEPVASKVLESSVTADAPAVVSKLTKDTVVKNNPGFVKTIVEGFQNKDYGSIANAVLDQTQKFGKAMFTKTDGSIDKAAVMGALAFSASYIEAKALAAEMGVDDDLTEAEYDELKKADKQEEYASYLTNFFAGRKDGGRIGFKRGSPEDESEVGIMAIDVEVGDDDEEDTEMAAGISFNSAEKSYLFRKLGGAGGASRSYTMPMLYKILNNPGAYPNDARVLKQLTIGLGLSKKDGGRIGLESGTPRAGLAALTSPNPNQKSSNYITRKSPTKELDLMNMIYEDQGNEGLQAYLERNPELMEKYLILSGMDGELSILPNPDYMDMENILVITGDGGNQIEILNDMVKESRAQGGRIGYKGGSNRVAQLLILRDEAIGKGEDTSIFDAELFQLTGKTFRSVGGISNVPTGNLRKNKAGVIERDYRDEGGFVPVGIKERADDVPAMLSKNEFVMTADAVRGIGGGDVEKGSKRLYNTMKQAEKVGKA